MTATPDQRYALMTPARNEERNIPRLLRTVAAQTLKPVYWAIVDDGSTDSTREMVRNSGQDHPYIHLLTRSHHQARTFASKALALREAYDSMKPVAFGFIGNLDADIELPHDYYEKMLMAFGGAPQLGLAGGLVHDVDGKRLIRHNCNLRSVAGAVQLFRREVYEAIGGYQPCAVGGIDTIAEVSTRMQGWDVQTFPEIVVRHHRQMGTASHGALQAAWRVGRKDYRLGYDPIFYLLMCIAHAFDRPCLVGSLLRGVSYLCQATRQAPIEAPPEVAAYMRREQRDRLKRMLCPSMASRPVQP